MKARKRVLGRRGRRSRRRRRVSIKRIKRSIKSIRKSIKSKMGMNFRNIFKGCDSIVIKDYLSFIFMGIIKLIRLV